MTPAERSALSRTRAKRLQVVTAKLDEHVHTIGQPWIKPEIPTREVLRILRDLQQAARGEVE